MIPPSSLTMAAFAADAAVTTGAARQLSINDLNQHSFAWLVWLIVLTLLAIVALGAWHLLAGRRRNVRTSDHATTADHREHP